MRFQIASMTEEWLNEAARVHSEAWKESHRSFCSESFVQAHTIARQRAYLVDQIAQGKRFFVLHEHGKCLGLVSEQDGLIENLYVDPLYYRKGFGTMLLEYACSLHRESRLWVLSNNVRAIALYEKHGFQFTGREKRLNEGLSELEMQR